MTKNIAAAILAGGKASRLGGLAKGNILRSNGLTIIEHLLAEFDKVGIHDVIIVSKNPAYQRYNKPMIADKRQNIGPLAGIEAALSYYRSNYHATLFLPCDMPNFSENEMRVLLDKFQGKDTVFAVTGDEDWHPLCAVVNNDWLDDISKLIDAGNRSIKDVWLKCRGKPIFFSNNMAFANINTIGDALAF
ncbi:MAG: molybdenum cofactor guanylyltransferase [Gammaproteobacteria bacterium]|jgi:molybdopterin-guanine dinucleotide biosynthesis protein A